METAPPQFAHVLLFACPVCFRPLVTACNSTNRNLEVADGYDFSFALPLWVVRRGNRHESQEALGGSVVR